MIAAPKKKAAWTNSSGTRPCRVCGNSSGWCSETTGTVLCRSSGAPDRHPQLGKGRPGRDKNGNPFRTYKLKGQWVRYSPPSEAVPTDPEPDRPDFTGRVAEYASDLRPEQRDWYAGNLGVPSWMVDRVPGLGYREQRGKPEGVAQPEYNFVSDPNGRACGVVIRVARAFRSARKPVSVGDKRTEGKRGLTFFAGDPEDVLCLIHEGNTDPLVSWGMGLTAVGVPGVGNGEDDLFAFFQARPHLTPVFVTEADSVANGEWPTRVKTYNLAARLAKRLGRTVYVADTPHRTPKGFRERGAGRKPPKDVRDWFHHAGGDRDTTPERAREMGRFFLAELKATAVPVEPELESGIVSEPDPAEAPVCPHGPRCRVHGGRGTPHEGRRRVAKVRCRVQACPECSRWSADKHLRHLGRLLAWHGDFDRAAEADVALPVVRPRMNSVGASPKESDRLMGPWTTLVACVDDGRRDVLLQSLRNRRAGFVTIQHEDQTVTRDTAGISLLLFLKRDSGGISNARTNTLVIASLQPGESWPPGMRAAGVGEAYRLARRALASPPAHTPGVRRQIVTYSAGWHPAPPEPSGWKREGRAAAELATTKAAAAELGIPTSTVTPNPETGIMGGLEWDDASAGGPLLSWLMGRLQERTDPAAFAKKPTVGSIVSTFRAWQETLQGVADGSEVRRVVDESLFAGPPGDDVRKALQRAAEADETFRREAAEFDGVDPFATLPAFRPKAAPEQAEQARSAAAKAASLHARIRSVYASVPPLPLPIRAVAAGDTGDQTQTLSSIREYNRGLMDYWRARERDEWRYCPKLRCYRNSFLERRSRSYAPPPKLKPGTFA